MNHDPIKVPVIPTGLRFTDMDLLSSLQQFGCIYCQKSGEIELKKRSETWDYSRYFILNVSVNISMTFQVVRRLSQVIQKCEIC